MTSLTLFASAMVRADIPAVHGMLLFGKNATYASHLPMFHSPHDYQLIMKLSLEDLPRSQTLSHYETWKEKGQTLFTLVPEIVDLTQIINGGKTTLNASIYKGHFENGGENLGPVKIHIQKLIYSSKLDGTQVPENLENYFVFGEAGEYFAAHLIQSKPSFDAIINVSQAYELKIPFCRTRVCDEPSKTLIDDGQLPITVGGPKSGSSFSLPIAGEQLGDLGGPIVDVLNIVYLEEAELAH